MYKNATVESLIVTLNLKKKLFDLVDPTRVFVIRDVLGKGSWMPDRILPVKVEGFLDAGSFIVGSWVEFMTLDRAHVICPRLESVVILDQQLSFLPI